MFTECRSKKNAGFTLVEAVITFTILMMISVGLVSMILHSEKAWCFGCKKYDAAASVDVLFQKLNVDIREASNAASTGNELSLDIPPVTTDEFGEKYCDLSAAPVVYRYYLQDGKIYQQIGADRPRSFASYSTENEITFSVTGNLVTVTTHKKDNPEAVIDEFKVVMRNYQGQK
ncbi:MAG: prepilin-type N-terminal cleavage/methylation domain-containing protein [Armatimonadota bacterium]